MPRPAPVLNGGWRVEVIQVVDLATPSHAKPEEATRYPAELTPQVSSKHPITGSRLFSRSLVDCRLVPIAERHTGAAGATLSWHKPGSGRSIAGSVYGHAWRLRRPDTNTVLVVP